MKTKDANLLLAPYIEQEKIIFNQIDSIPEDPKFIDPLKAKSKKNSLKTKLTKALRFQEKLKQLPEEKAEKIKYDTTWKAAMIKARGEKIKDDPDLLKKSIKKKESIKKMHKKKWNDRTKKQEQVQEMTKKKKQRNIDRRRELKRNSKKKGSRKR